MARIFISYRRDDAGGHAGRLFALLQNHFQPDDVFLDVEGIEDGKRWDLEIKKKVDGCQALLVVIGKTWLKAQDKDGRRRISLPTDWVRNEILSALKRKILLIPILVDGAEFPAKTALPKSLQPLSLHQGRAIRHSSASADVKELLDQLKGILETPSADTAEYFRKLRVDTEFIDIKGIQVGQRKAPRFEIKSLYTPLTTVVRREGVEKQEQEAVPLQQVLNEPRLVLVGDPGAGKSTFLRRIVFAACEKDEEFLGKEIPFPILIEASALSSFIEAEKSEPKRPHIWDSHEWLGHYLAWKSSENDWGLTREFLLAKLKGGCLLLVDGLDEAPDRERRKALARLLEKASGAYEKTRIVVTSRPSAYGGETELSGYRTVEIAPLDREAISAFAANWYGGLYPEDPAAATSLARSLEDSVYTRPEIEEMALNPVMLTSLAVLHWNEARLPDQRAELYNSVLTWLARARDDRRREQHHKRASAERCRALLQHLAFSMHADEKGMLKEISPEAAAAVLADRFREVSDAEGRKEAAEQFLRDEEIDSGILVGRNKKLRFWHRTFQEYLAARALAGRDGDRRMLLFEKRRLHLREWRETVLLLSGVLCDQDTDKIDEFLGEILDLAARGPLVEKAKCIGLIGQVLWDLKAWKYRIGDLRYERFLLECLPLLEDAAMAGSVEFLTRLEVADALGQFGDPRLAEDKKWVRVQGKFWLGRYPVTVGEFAAYLKETGGEPPNRWHEQIKYPNRPVVRVDWNQASEYCKWAGGRLPTSEEWEFAARDGRAEVEYPWGSEEPDEHKANFDDKVGHATPVGMYPEGATPSKLFDMAGNVWEWCEDWYDSRKATKVLRGGAWYSYSSFLWVSGRNDFVPDERDDYSGFRCFRERL